MRYVFLFLIGCLIASCAKEDEVGAVDLGQIGFLGEVEWVRTFGGSGEETAQAVIATTDGGYAVLGFTNSTDGDVFGKSTPVNDYWLLKFDAQGDLQWNKTYGGSKDDRGQSLVQTNDGGFALTGYAMSDDGDGSINNGFHDNWVIKVDAQGALQWEKSFGFSGHDHSYDIITTEDGGYFFTGFLDITAAREDGNTEKFSTLTRHGVGEFWGTKIDATGALQWRGYFGGTNNDRSHAVVRSDDGGFVMSGFSESADFDISNTQGSYDFWLVKIDANGNFLWERSFGGTGIEISYDIAKTRDGGYVITGNTFSTDGDVSNTNGASDIWMVKVDKEGQMLWERTYGGSGFDAAQAVIASKNGGYFIVGNTKSTDKDASTNYGENDIWMMKTDESGNLVWQKSFGGSGFDFGFDVVEHPDGSIVLVGEMASSDMEGVVSKGKSDVVMLKVR